jgi:hypothetical protein
MELHHPPNFIKVVHVIFLQLLKGLGVANLLTSELFGLLSQLDPGTESMLGRKRQLAYKDELNPDEIEELSALDTRLSRLGFTMETRDPLYALFLQTMAKLRKERGEDEAKLAAPQTPEEREALRQLALDILQDLMANEGEELQ